jgi:hypothetical protein
MTSVKDGKGSNVDSEIFANNLAVLKDLFPHVYDQLRRGPAVLPFPVKFITTKHGQTNAVVSLPAGPEIALYEGEDIIGSIWD